MANKGKYFVHTMIDYNAVYYHIIRLDYIIRSSVMAYSLV